MTVADLPEECIFSGFPLDPADHRRSDAGWLGERLADPASRFVVYAGDRPLMNVAGTLRPAVKCAEDIAAFADGDWRDLDRVFIGLEGDQAWFAIALAEKAELPPDEKFIDLRSVAGQMGSSGFNALPALLGRGKMLLDWNGRRRFCSCCGAETRAVNGGYLRKCRNTACGAEHFPRTDPVVIMLVTRGTRCLLGRGVGWPEGHYSALAGFMEPGETIEEAVRREVGEEAGVRIGAVRYVKSQPWPFPSSLMIGVRAAALTTKITLDDELADAAWFERDQLRALLEKGGDDSFRIPPRIAIARHLLEEWLYE